MTQETSIPRSNPNPRSNRLSAAIGGKEWALWNLSGKLTVCHGNSPWFKAGWWFQPL